MAPRRRQRFVPIMDVMRARLPARDDHAHLVAERRVLVDGCIATNPDGRVRHDASIRVLPPRRLRGEHKLSIALEAFGVDVTGQIALDVGASAGGFTTALLRAGARRVYAVDAGHGQLVGSLRLDPRVVNLERTNVSDLDPTNVPDTVEVVTIDLSYTSVGDAIAQLGALRLARTARLMALVKPTFELGRGRVVLDRRGVEAAIDAALRRVEHAGWCCEAVTLPAASGRRGAIEAFILAGRLAPAP